MKKMYILDTSVLLHDPNSLYSFEENDIVIPYEVTTEIDHFKKGTEEINVNARELNRQLEPLSKKNSVEGIPLGDKGGKLFFVYDQESASRRGEYVDDALIAWAKKLSATYSKRKIILVSKDFNLRLRARISGVEAEDYLHDKVRLDVASWFKQRVEYEIASPELINVLYSKKEVICPPELQTSFYMNQYVTLKHGSQSVLAKYREGKLFRVPSEQRVEGITPKNSSQHFLLDACLDERLTMISCLGKAGTGKTLLALVAGLHQVMPDGPKRYHNVTIFRPMIETGKELGYLPGEVHEKIAPHFEAIEGALELIVGEAGKEYPAYNDWIKFSPINYIKGKTFHQTFMLVDEAQNFTPQEIKTIGTRMGEGSKIVLVGDPFQTDNPYLDEKSNGLTVVTDEFRHKFSQFAYVILDKVERSREAGIFADHL